MTWAFIAHKGGYWAGVISAEVPKSDLKRFLGDFGVDGFDITTVHSREEYLAKIKELKFWHDSPEWIAKHGKKKRK